MIRNQFNTWLDYVDFATRKNLINGKLDNDKLLYFLDLSQSGKDLFYTQVPFIYVLDYASGKYLIMQKGVKNETSYLPIDYINKGLSMFMDKCHSDDLRLYNEEIFPYRLKILAAIPADEHKDHVFSYTYRFKTKSGDYNNVLQKNILISSEDNKGQPLLSIGTLINVNHLVNENPVTHLVEKINRQENALPRLIEKKIFFINGINLFTKREKEILKWSAEGLCSKQIADKLFISEYTVINHKRNMMAKSNCRNTPELVKYGFTKMII